MECLELVQTTVDETDVIHWLTQLIQFFFGPSCKRITEEHNPCVVVYKANGRLANPCCFWSPTKKKPNLHLKQPTSDVAGCTLAGQPAKFRAQLQENGLARIAKSGIKQNYLTDVLHPPPAPFFVFPSVPGMACGAACVDG